MISKTTYKEQKGYYQEIHVTVYELMITIIVLINVMLVATNVGEIYKDLTDEL